MEFKYFSNELVKLKLFRSTVKVNNSEKNSVQQQQQQKKEIGHMSFITRWPRKSGFIGQAACTERVIT